MYSRKSFRSVKCKNKNVKMDKKIFIAGILVVVLLFSGCVTKEEVKESDKEKAIEECVKICKNFKNSGEDLDSKCLSNDFYPDWVCDVAHSPRKAEDNLPENQCSAFREGKAHHFVEVDENCTLIRAI